MSDDSFIREVNEELRQDQATAFWKRYGLTLIAAAVALVLATAGWRYFEYRRDAQASASGDRFLSALDMIRDGKRDEAQAALKALEADGYGSYPVLARMRNATLLAQSGDAKGAVAAFDAVAADTAVPEAIRDIARLRAGLLLVDNGTYEEVAGRVEALSSDTGPMRFGAREALGLAAWKAGRTSDAQKLFEQITQDRDSPRNVAERARIMLELMRGTGNPETG